MPPPMHAQAQAGEHEAAKLAQRAHAAARDVRAQARRAAATAEAQSAAQAAQIDQLLSRCGCCARQRPLGRSANFWVSSVVHASGAESC